MKKIALSLIVPFLIGLNANDISQNEISTFVAQKYKMDYNSQTQENKEKMKKEYENVTKVVNLIAKEVKNDDDLKATINLITFSTWAKKYMQNLKINDETLKKLYKNQKPKTVASYNLYNILLSDKKKADEIIIKLEKVSKDDRLKEFKKQVKDNSEDFISNKKEGNIGWLKLQQIDKNIQESIKDKKTNDLLLVNVGKVGWQIILIADYKAEKDATFEESKEFLINLAKKEELIKKIDTLLNKE